jgi:hypothetical protein
VRLEPLLPKPPALREATVLPSPPLALADLLPLEVLTTALAPIRSTESFPSPAFLRPSSGDFHATAAGKMVRAGELTLPRPVHVVVTGTLGTGDIPFPSCSAVSNRSRWTRRSSQCVELEAGTSPCGSARANFSATGSALEPTAWRARSKTPRWTRYGKPMGYAACRRSVGVE